MDEVYLTIVWMRHTCTSPFFSTLDGEDFVAETIQISIPNVPGDPICVQFMILNDEVAEETESFTVDFSGLPTGVVDGRFPQAWVNIIDRGGKFM